MKLIDNFHRHYHIITPFKNQLKILFKMKNRFLTICLFSCFVFISNLAKSQVGDGICSPSTTIAAITVTNPVPPAPIIACSNGMGLPTFGVPVGSLPDEDFIVEINGTIDNINSTGDPVAALSDGDQICVTAATYDLVAINGILTTLNSLCPIINCDVTLGIPGITTLISDLHNGVNDGTPGINSLEEFFTFASGFGAPITSVSAAPAAIDNFNTQAGGLVGNICYAFSAAECYTIDDANVACTALPVSLTKFDLTVENAGVSLFWQTASEINNEGFEIQISRDFRTWETLDFIKGNGTTSEPQQYTYLHTTPFIGTNYYRLKQMDQDGHVEYSNAISTKFQDKTSDPNLVIFPNPVSNMLNYQVSNLSEVLSIKLYDINGSLVKVAKQIDGGLSMQEFNAGTYVLVMTTERDCVKELVVKR